MRASRLSTAVAIGTLLAGCGGAAVCPDRAVPQGAPSEKAQPAPDTASADSAAPPRLEGTYRAVELRQGDKVTPVADVLLSQARSCHAMRVLWSFHERTLGMTLEMLCDTEGTERSVDLCRASLEVGIQWRPDGFEIPADVRAAGTVDRIGLKFEQIPGGMRRSTDKISRGCNISMKAAAIRIKEKKGDSLVLSTEEGDMLFVPEPNPEALDWNRESLRLYEERHGAK